MRVVIDRTFDAEWDGRTELTNIVVDGNVESGEDKLLKLVKSVLEEEANVLEPLDKRVKGSEVSVEPLNSGLLAVEALVIVKDGKLVEVSQAVVLGALIPSYL